MKKILLLMLLLITCIRITSRPLSVITEKEAVDMVSSLYGSDDVKLYCGSVTVGDTIWYSRTHYELSPSSCWVVFADEKPLLSWGHDCSLFFVGKNAEQGSKPSYTRKALQGPPLNLDLTPTGTNASLPRQSPTPSIVPVTPRSIPSYIADHQYAIIVNGGYNKNYNNYRFWNDCSYFYSTLINHYCFKKSNIRVLISDGTDPADDMRDVNGNYISSPLDLDGDGVGDITGAATVANLQSAFQEMQSLGSNDVLTVFFTGNAYGSTGPGNYVYDLWDGYVLNTNFRSVYGLDSIHAGAINIVMCQPFSGAFISPLQTMNNIVITTSCNDDGNSPEIPSVHHTHFAYHWINGINRCNKVGTMVSSDQDYDCLVTMYEAYDYAHDFLENENFPTICAQYYSNGQLGSSLTLFGLDYDHNITIRDNSGGHGAIFGPTNSFNSPDIYLRNQADGLTNQSHEHIIFTGTLSDTVRYAYVRVKNEDTKPYSGMGKYLNLYWHSGQLFYSPAVAPFPPQTPVFSGSQRGYLRSYEITSSLAPGASTLLECPFPVPVELYQEAVQSSGIVYMGVIAWFTDDAIIDSSYPFPQPEATIILQNDNIAMKNAQVVYMSGRQLTVPLVLRNNGKESISYDIQVCMGGNRASSAGVSMSASLSSTPSASTYFPLVDGRIEDILVNADSENYVTLSLTLDAPLSDGEEQTVDIIQTNHETGEVVGGHTLILRKAMEDIRSQIQQALIENICVSESGVQVDLTQAAMETMLIRVSPADSPQRHIDTNVPVGQSGAFINLPEDYRGLMIVTLIQNGETIDTKKFIQ